MSAAIPTYKLPSTEPLPIEFFQEKISRMGRESTRSAPTRPWTPAVGGWGRSRLDLRLRGRPGREPPRSTPTAAAGEGAASIRSGGVVQIRAETRVGRGNRQRRSDGEERAAPHRCVRFSSSSASNPSSDSPVHKPNRNPSPTNREIGGRSKRKPKN